MSTSQKFQRKVLVPWYNSFEWKFVYEILSQQKNDDYLKALAILKVWRIRAPLLSAGVEGTLIILDTLIQNKDGLSEEQLVQLYSISLMRLLNLTAGNNEKQGTFHQTVARNDLPKWLIDIRHDIAHNNKLPCKSVLELSMIQCLHWIVEKYWKMQNELICDYVATQNPHDSKITELLSIYCELQVNLYYNTDINKNKEGLLRKINYFVTKRHNKESIDFYGMLNILEEMLKQAMESIHCKKSSDEIVEILVSSKALFAISREESVLEIPPTYYQIWRNIINILIENGMLFVLGKKLNELTNDLLTNNKIKKLSSLWLKIIIQGLLIIKFQDNLHLNNLSDNIKKYIFTREEGNFLKLNPGAVDSFDSVLFEELLLQSPNIYTLEYLELVLYYNDTSEEKLKYTIDLVKSIINENCYNFTQNIANTNGIEEFNENDSLMDFEDVNIRNHQTVNLPQTDSLKSKWTKVKNKSDYEGCPLGILPHQNRSKNPCLILHI